MPIRTFLCATVVLGAMTALSGCTSSGTASQSPQQIVAAARSAALAKGSAHIEVHGVANGTPETYINDSGRNAGRQVISVGDEHETILLTAGVAYTNGNVAALTGLLGLSADVASRVAGQWIAMQPGQPGYTTVSAGVSLASAVSEAFPSGHLRRQGTTTVEGRRVVAIRGDFTLFPSSGVLYVATSGPPLPVRATMSRGGTSQTISLSRWGEAVTITPPSDALPIMSVLPTGV